MLNLYHNVTILAHAFGARYELPIPLILFMLSGAGVVLASFALVLPRRVKKAEEIRLADTAPTERSSTVWTAISLLGLAATIACGLLGSQEVAENIVPTLFWLLVWIAVPLSCGLVGDWTRRLNPFRNLSLLTDSEALRQRLIGRRQPLGWPAALGWWPAVGLFFVLACGELIFNQTATLPAVTATGLLGYAVVCAVAGMLFGPMWAKQGEVFSVLYDTWGRLGFWRFGAPGKRGLAGGLSHGFAAAPSRIAFVLLLLVNVSFDGLQSTPLWSHFEHSLPYAAEPGTIGNRLVSVLVFMCLLAAAGLLFGGFATAVARFGRLVQSTSMVLAGLLPSLLPISFGYLLAHNLEYLVTNGQLLFPLIGNPVGSSSWPLHLAYPFNDTYEPNIHVLPSAIYWYVAVAVIVAVHVMAVVLAHHYLATTTTRQANARRSEYPWVIAMVAYTMLSLWLLAQPLTEESKPKANESLRPIAPYVLVNKDRAQA